MLLMFAAIDAATPCFRYADAAAIADAISWLPRAPCYAADAIIFCY